MPERSVVMTNSSEKAMGSHPFAGDGAKIIFVVDKRN